MMEDARAAGRAAFEQSLGACMDDLNAMLPDLTHRYEINVVVSAMAEHVGTALQVLRRKKLVSDRQAGLAIAHIEKWAFGPRQPAEPKAEEPPEGGSDPSRD